MYSIVVPIKAHSTFKVTCPWDPTATFNLHVYSVIQLIAYPTLCIIIIILIHSHQLLAPHTLYYLAAAVCVSCQELTSTLHERNRTCPGEEVIFTCTVRGPSSLLVIGVAWSSAEYISGQGGSLQLSTANMIGDVETSTQDGSVTATSTVINNTNVNGELILVTTLRITAVEASTVTCTDPNRAQASIEFTVSGTYSYMHNLV